MGFTNIVALIMTHNNVNDLDKTWESIQEQDFSKEDIWTCIVDFDSTDGTYEKALSYDRYHTAVFQVPDVYDERARLSRAASLLGTQPFPGAIQHTVSLKPGDVLYKSCFSVCAETLRKYRTQGFSRMVCEADIIDPNGTIVHQPKIAEREITLSPVEDCNFLLEEFPCHYVGYLGGGVSPSHHSYVANERCFWNKTPYGIAAGTKLIYLPQTLLCLKERAYRDEVEELLSRWERITSLQRRVREQTGHGLKINMANVNHNLANYSLWRISKRYPELTLKEREDLLYLAEIIDPSISKTEVYKEFCQKVKAGSELCYADYEAYFEQESEKGRKRLQAAIEAGIIETAPGGF